MNKRKELLERGMQLLFLLCGIVAVAFVLVLSVYLILSGVPAIREIGLWRFLFGKTWAPTATTVEPSFGILPFLLSSVYGTAGACLLGVPIGILTAVCLAKAAPPKVASAIGTEMCIRDRLRRLLGHGLPEEGGQREALGLVALALQRIDDELADAVVVLQQIDHRITFISFTS